jgi:hypothetical protein
MEIEFRPIGRPAAEAGIVANDGNLRRGGKLLDEIAGHGYRRKTGTDHDNIIYHRILPEAPYTLALVAHASLGSRKRQNHENKCLHSL